MQIMKQARSGVLVPELCREHGMSSETFYSWRSKYGGMDASLISQTEALAVENVRTKFPSSALIIIKPLFLSIFLAK